MTRQKYNIFKALLLCCIASGCYEKPAFPLEPVIQFNFILSKPIIDSLSNFYLGDSILIAIDYTDGDGDLGLAPRDTLPPYQLYLDPERTQINRFHFNFFCEPERFENGTYVPFVLPDGVTLNGRFGRLTDKPSPVDGTIFYRFFIPAFSTDPQYTINPFEILRFRISIADRALNESNVVLTDSVIVNQVNL